MITKGERMSNERKGEYARPKGILDIVPIEERGGRRIRTDSTDDEGSRVESVSLRPSVSVNDGDVERSVDDSKTDAKEFFPKDFLFKAAYKLFCFDFDNTISSAHVHQRVRAMLEDPTHKIHKIHKKRVLGIRVLSIKDFCKLPSEKQWELVREVVGNIPPRGEKGQMRALLQQLIDKHKRIAITSFGDFPGVVKEYLRQIVGLEERYLNRVHINCWRPDKNHQKGYGKNQHLEDSLGDFCESLRIVEAVAVVLIDDESLSIRKAGEVGYFGIDAGKPAKITDQALFKQVCEMAEIRMEEIERLADWSYDASSNNLVSDCSATLFSSFSQPSISSRSLVKQALTDPRRTSALSGSLAKQPPAQPLKKSDSGCCVIL